MRSIQQSFSVLWLIVVLIAETPAAGICQSSEMLKAFIIDGWITHA